MAEDSHPFMFSSDEEFMFDEEDMGVGNDEQDQGSGDGGAGPQEQHEWAWHELPCGAPGCHQKYHACGSMRDGSTLTWSNSLDFKHFSDKSVPPTIVMGAHPDAAQRLKTTFNARSHRLSKLKERFKKHLQTCPHATAAYREEMLNVLASTKTTLQQLPTPAQKARKKEMSTAAQRQRRLRQMLDTDYQTKFARAKFESVHGGRPERRTRLKAWTSHRDNYVATYVAKKLATGKRKQEEASFTPAGHAVGLRSASGGSGSGGGGSGSGGGGSGSGGGATKKRSRQADVVLPTSVAVKAEEQRDPLMGGCPSTTAGNSKRARRAGFAPSVPAAVKAEATRKRAATHARKSSGSESEVEAETECES